ncbi:uncharacterized protein LOC132300118 [Cornus florida]|uniref:uncharacterized protein LOC132300118 n=1 Tax=Cornus florida TaxID=4283 RepID=UPI00289B3C3F|nr:uncharacterized protein LOC132300118 [Cornus florida]
MAATSKPVSIKRLAEHLEDQQEPFKLDVYLSQRRYTKKSSKLETRNGSNLYNSVKNLTESSSTYTMIRKGLPYGSKTLELVLDALASYKSCGKLLRLKHKARKNGEEKDSKTPRKQEEIAKNRLSSSGSRTPSSSCSKGNIKARCTPEQNHSSSYQRTFQALKLHNLLKLEAASNSKQQWGCIEENNQLSPASVLEELQSEEGSPVVQHFLVPRKEETTLTCSFNLPRVKEDTIFSATMCQLLAQSLTEKHNCVGAAELHGIESSSSQFLNAKRVLMQTKRLVFDCVKEAIDTHGRRARRQKRLKGVLGPEELGKIVCDQIYEWGNQSGDETNVNQLISWDYSNTEEEWSDFHMLTRHIGIEIGDAILDNIVVETIKSL